MTTTLEGLDEDWFAEVISDSLEMDWRPRDAARLIVERMAEQFPALTTLQAEVDRLREAFANNVGPDDPAGCPGEHGSSCCGWHNACRTALKTGA